MSLKKEYNSNKFLCKLSTFCKIKEIVKCLDYDNAQKQALCKFILFIFLRKEKMNFLAKFSSISKSPI